MDYSIIIPARYHSTRLPGKVLLDIAGKPMLQHVYELARQTNAKNIVIATDDQRIATTAEAFGAVVCLTKATHSSGSERIAEAAELLGYSEDEIIFNLQADEPLLSPNLIQQTVDDLIDHPAADVATLCAKITTKEELDNPNITKVVMDQAGYALYFSRAAIPWHRDARAKQQDIFSGDTHYYRHIGLYAYRCRTLKKYVNWSRCFLEEIESLEQLRVLWHGGKIHVSCAIEAVSIGVDTPEDLESVRSFFLENNTE